MPSNSSLFGIAPVVMPQSRVSLTAAASAASTTQGQFATIDTSTRIVVGSTASIALNVILGGSPFSEVVAAGLVDGNGLLQILVDQGANGQTVNSITLTPGNGTLVFQHVGTRYGQFAVLPNSDGRVSGTIALSAGNANTRVTLLNRTFNASNTVSTV